jgi:hypothetical protein
MRRIPSVGSGAWKVTSIGALTDPNRADLEIGAPIPPLVVHILFTTTRVVVRPEFSISSYPDFSEHV